MATALVNTRTTVATVCKSTYSTFREPSEDQFQTCRASIASIENIWSGSICCIRCTNCSASSRVSNIIRLYNRPARTWSHLHIVSVIALPPSNRLSSRFSSQSKSAYLSSLSLLLTSNTFPGDKSHSTRQFTQSNFIKMRGTRSGTPLIFTYVDATLTGLHLFLFIHVDILCINYAFVLLRLLVRLSVRTSRCRCAVCRR